MAFIKKNSDLSVKLNNVSPSFVFRRGKGRTQLSLLPRSLHRQAAGVGKVENGTAAEKMEGTVNTTGEPRTLSNSDFAKMLLNK